MHRNLTVIIGPNGSGKTSLVKTLIADHQISVKGLGIASGIEELGWPILNVYDFPTPVVVVGKYSDRNLLGGADLIHGKTFWEELEYLIRETHCNILVEGQRFGYGVNYERLSDLCEEYGLGLKVVLVDLSSRKCFSRIKKRQAKKSFHRRKPVGTGYYSLENIEKQRNKILNFFRLNIRAYKQTLDMRKADVEDLEKFIAI